MISIYIKELEVDKIEKQKIKMPKGLKKGSEEYEKAVNLLEVNSIKLGAIEYELKDQKNQRKVVFLRLNKVKKDLDILKKRKASISQRSTNSKDLKNIKLAQRKVAVKVVNYLKQEKISIKIDKTAISKSKHPFVLFSNHALDLTEETMKVLANPDKKGREIDKKKRLTAPSITVSTVDIVQLMKQAKELYPTDNYLYKTDDQLRSYVYKSLQSYAEENTIDLITDKSADEKYKKLLKKVKKTEIKLSGLRANLNKQMKSIKALSDIEKIKSTFDTKTNPTVEIKATSETFNDKHTIAELIDSLFKKNKKKHIIWSIDKKHAFLLMSNMNKKPEIEPMLIQVDAKGYTVNKTEKMSFGQLKIRCGEYDMMAKSGGLHPIFLIHFGNITAKQGYKELVKLREMGVQRLYSPLF